MLLAMKPSSVADASATALTECSLFPKYAHLLLVLPACLFRLNKLRLYLPELLDPVVTLKRWSGCHRAHGMHPSTVLSDRSTTIMIIEPT